MKRRYAATVNMKALLVILVWCATCVRAQDPNYLAHGLYHPDVQAVIPVDTKVGPSPGGVKWADSYSSGDSCYCYPSSNRSPDIDNYFVETPKGWLTVKEICTLLGPGPGASGNPIYNDVQCGNGPPNAVGWEHSCPGRVDIGRNGCGQIGPKWNFDEVSMLPVAPQSDKVFRDVGSGDAQDTQGLTGQTWTHKTKHKDNITGLKNGDNPDWFRTHRSSKTRFSYTLDGLTPGKKYRVELGFAEIWKPNCQVGLRLQRILIENKVVRDKLDVFAAAGCMAAHYEIFDGNQAITANGAGKIKITLEAQKENAMLSTIKIDPATNSNPPPPPPPPPPGPSPSSSPTKIVIDAGSPSEGKTLAQGKTWTFAVGSNVFIAKTDQRPKYRTHRSAPKLVYVIPDLQPGSKYNVGLGFAEIWRPNCKDGKRVFDIKLNGRTVSRNVDVYKDSGGCETALYKEYKDIAADSRGRIIIEIIASVENGMISLIEITGEDGGNGRNSGDKKVSIDVGSSSGDDTSALDGKATRWGSSSRPSQVPLPYRSHRWGPDFKYTFDGYDPNKTYEIRLGFAEAFTGNCVEGKRRFQVRINGSIVQSNLDVYKAAGGCATSGKYLLLRYDRKPSSQGKFEIRFIKIENNSMVSLIEIEPK